MGWWIAAAHLLVVLASSGKQNSCEYKKYVVNSESPLCSGVGKRILKAGGNAMDAAIATTVCVGVVNSYSSGIGGGGFMMVRKNLDGVEQIDFLDFRETAPGGLSIKLLHKRAESTRLGGLAVGTPAEMIGLHAAHVEYGRLPWKQLFSENVKIAKGFRVTELLARKLERNKMHILRDPGMRQVYARGKKGKLLETGDWAARPNYAKTLETIASDPETVRTGKIAKRMVAYVQKQGGVLALSDLAKYKVARRDVLEGSFKGFRVFTTSLPTMGVLVLEGLKLLEKVDFEELKKQSKNDRLFYLYKILIRVLKGIYKRRGEFGDPDFASGQHQLVSEIVSDDYNDKLLMEVATGSKLVPTGAFVPDHGTTHLEVVDSDGMMVQVTSTVNLEFGAKLMDPQTGILFNNQIDDFYVPGISNAYNFLPMRTNILEPGKRPISSSAPVLLESPDERIMIGGTGGSRIPSAILGALAYINLGYTLPKAISSPRIHNQLSPDITYIEENFPLGVRKRLEGTGEKFEVSEMNKIFTSVQVLRMKRDQQGAWEICAVADPRKKGGVDGE